MRPLPLLAALALLTAPALVSSAWAADKRVYKIDSVIAIQKGGAIVVQAKGAVQTGGWKNARLHVIHGDKGVMTVEFIATAPPPGMTVIEALVPVEAQTRIHGHAVSVRVMADANEVTAQVLH